MNYTVKLSKDVHKFLQKCDHHVAERFFVAAHLFEKDNHPSQLDIKPLQWEERWHYRLRIGKYRFM